MAVLIEGINRPTEPRKCKFFDIDPLGVRKPFCAIQSVCDGLESCPLIEVPTPHGRLIDADELEKDAEWSDYYDEYTAYSEYQIGHAPTIIEAEGE